MGKTGSLAPFQGLADRLIVGGPSVFVADRNREEFEVPVVNRDIQKDIGVIEVPPTREPSGFMCCLVTR